MCRRYFGLLPYLRGVATAAGAACLERLLFRIRTWQAGAALHSVSFFSIAEPADVEAQGLDIVDALRHHQVLVHQVAAVRVRLEQRTKTRAGGGHNVFLKKRKASHLCIL